MNLQFAPQFVARAFAQAKLSKDTWALLTVTDELKLSPSCAPFVSIAKFLNSRDTAEQFTIGLESVLKSIDQGQGVSWDAKEPMLF